MSKIKLLSIAIIALILINVATLSFFFTKGLRQMKSIEPKKIIIEKLHFDKTQEALYDQLIKVHYVKIKSLNDSVLKTKNLLYSQLSKTNNNKVTDSLFLQLASQQSAIEKGHYDHFVNIRKLCKREQVEDYDKLTAELSKLFSQKPIKVKHER